LERQERQARANALAGAAGLGDGDLYLPPDAENDEEYENDESARKVRVLSFLTTLLCVPASLPLPSLPFPSLALLSVSFFSL